MCMRVRGPALPLGRRLGVAVTKSSLEHSLTHLTRSFSVEWATNEARARRIQVQCACMYWEFREVHSFRVSGARDFLIRRANRDLGPDKGLIKIALSRDSLLMVSAYRDRRFHEQRDSIRETASANVIWLRLLVKGVRGFFSGNSKTSIASQKENSWEFGISWKSRKFKTKEIANSVVNKY